MSSSSVTCPACNRRLGALDFQCPHCELLLDTPALAQSFDAPVPTSIIQALLAPPQASLAPQTTPSFTPGAPAHPQEGFDGAMATRRMSFAAKPHDVAVVVASLELTAHNISSFEAFVISRMDGQSDVECVRNATGLSDPEMQAVLVALLEKQVIRMERAEPRAAPPPVAAEPVRVVLPPPTPELQDDAVAPNVAPAARVAPAMAAAPRAAPPPPAATTVTPPEEKKAPVHHPAPPAKKPRAAPVEPLQQAIALEQSGDIDRAIEVLEQAVARSRTPAPLYNRLGIVILKERRDFRRAEEYLLKATTLDPDNAVYKQNYVRVLELSATHSGPRRSPVSRGGKDGPPGALKKLMGVLFSFRK